MAERKKKFFEVSIPLINQKIHVFSYDANSLQGRIIKLDLTRILKGKNFDATIIIEKKDDQLIGRFTALSLIPSFIIRMMRKSISYVEDSFKCNNIQLKPFMLTRKKVHRSVRNALRKKTKEFLMDYANKNENDIIFEDMLTGKLQKNLSLTLKKIYPLTFCEIRIAKEIKKE